MPNRDGTGPCGKGSKTGRQNGNCENTEPKFERIECNKPRRRFGRRLRDQE